MTADAGDRTPFSAAVDAVRKGADPLDEARAIYATLDERERLWLLDGDEPFWQVLGSMATGGFNERIYPQAQIDRVGLPGIQFTDGPRGVVIGPATTFPVSMARGATFDVSLEEQVGDVIGREARAVGANLYGGVCINLPRHPAWGRAQETYGDDPHQLGEMGAALVRGVQRHVMATAKHYALNSMENARFTVDVTIDEGALHDVYLPHFKRVTDEGVAAIMGAYNSVNGEWAGENSYLLTTVLRDYWGWNGITITDWIWGFRDAVKSVRAGMDIEEPARSQRERALPGALESGELSWDLIERSAVRVIAAQIRSYAERSTTTPDRATLADEAARELSRTVARRGMTLLKNATVSGIPVLPIDATTQKIALIGRLSVEPNVGDSGSSSVKHTPSTCSPYEGLLEAFPEAEFILVTDDDPDACATAAASADIAIVVVGYTAEDEGEYIGTDTFTLPTLAATYPPVPGEMDLSALTGDMDTIVASGLGGDRASLRLRPVDRDIILAVAKANPRNAVAIVSAGTVILDDWDDEASAILMMWYAGMEGGRALADVLTGEANPSGRLPAPIPTTEEHLPHFDANATAITYDRFHGQRLLDKLGVEAAYPYGFGLSYSEFSMHDAVIESLDEQGGRISLKVENQGTRTGHHVVEIFGKRTSGTHAGEYWLLGFLPVEVDPGAAVTALVDFSLLPLALWDSSTHSRVLPDHDEILIEVGSFAHDPQALTVLTPGVGASSD